MQLRWIRWVLVAAVGWALPLPAAVVAERVHFGREIRPILSENCFFCHGPDEAKREAGLRLDVEAAAKGDNGGVTAVVPGDPERSALIQRIVSADPEEVMPPPKQHKVIPPEQVERLREWIRQGAVWGNHWSYERVERPVVAAVGSRIAEWRRSENPVDGFIGARLRAEGLRPMPRAEESTLVRRVALDVTGLPPTLEELRELRDRPFGEVVDFYLAKPSYGEHWARQWLDLARYADSSGYPSDQPREIWAYRDWVIGALNANMAYDQFTIEQLAGDLLPKATDAQLIATAFHRNTMTQNEGGTSDEEFRVAAIIDRVNTTMAVWMGTTMACAQCHTHKYDPITINEYYSFYDFLNQTADADKKDEAPVHSFFTGEQLAKRRELEKGLAEVERVFSMPEPGVWKGLTAWESSLPDASAWRNRVPEKVVDSSGQALEVDGEGAVFSAGGKPVETYTVDLRLEVGAVEALRLEVLADERLPKDGPGHANGNFVLSKVRAEWVPDTAEPVRARYLRLEKVSERYDFLALAEVEVFSGGVNVARQGRARQVSTLVRGDGSSPTAALAVDGKTEGNSAEGKSVAITGGGDDPWWELDLGREQAVDRVVIWRRTDKGQGSTINDLKLSWRDDRNVVVWERQVTKTFSEREEVSVSGRVAVGFKTAFADVSQGGFDPADVVREGGGKDRGWAVAGHTVKDHALTLLLREPLKVEGPGRLRLYLEQGSKFDGHTLGAFRLATTSDPKVSRLSAVPAPVLAGLAVEAAERTAEQVERIRDHYVRQVAPELKAERLRRAELEKALVGVKPVTVPVMQELGVGERRRTQVQLRGNWQALGDEVTATTPTAFPPLPEGEPRNRLTLAKWLVSRENPLTARVAVNRLWESVFGVGIVRTSEEFGSQGELPMHPELLDWLAAEFMERGWDVKHVLRLLLTSEAYQQDSRTTPELNERDPDNRLLARGPRFRPTGEQTRDQALAAAGLLSGKRGGPGVRPLAPKLGLKAAFGRANDWETSVGEDRYRRSIYTEVQRNSPYASYLTFDGVNREVCTIRRNRTNTPLQAFVTLNDPVFIEANQAMARRLVNEGGVGVESRLETLFLLCLGRAQTAVEQQTLVRVLTAARAEFGADPEAAKAMATEPLGVAPDGMELAELAAWTVVANVVMNLDEFLMRR